MTNIIEYLVQIVSHRGDASTHVSGIPMSLIFQLKSDLVLAKGLRDGIEGLILRSKTETIFDELCSHVEALCHQMDSVKSIQKVIEIAFVIIQEHRLSFRTLTRVGALHSERSTYIYSGHFRQKWVTVDIVQPVLITDLWLEVLEKEHCRITYPPVNNKDMVSFIMSPVSHPKVSDVLFSLNVFLLLSCLMLSDDDSIKTGGYDVLQTFSKTACAAAELNYSLSKALAPLWIVNYSAVRSGKEHLVLRECELPSKVLEACAKLLLIDGELEGSRYIASALMHARGASASVFTVYGIGSIIGRADSFISSWVEFVRLCCKLRSDSSEIRKSIANVICIWAVETGRLAMILQSSIGDLVSSYHLSCFPHRTSGGRYYSGGFRDQSL